MIIKKLSKVGNSCGFIIDKAYLDLLNVNQDTDFEMKITDGNIVFTPVSTSKRADRLKNASTKFNQKYKKTLRKLAE